MKEETGRLFTINIISEKSLQVVIQKTILGKKSLIAYNVFGSAKFKFDKQRFNKNDKVVIKYIPKTELYNGRYRTELVLLEISHEVKKPKFNPYNQKPITENALFTESQIQAETEDDSDGIGGNHIIDEETGEILL